MPLKIVFLLTILFAGTAGRSQTKYIDSLKTNIAKAVTFEGQLKAIFALCEERQSFPADTMLYYIKRAEKITSNINSPFITRYELQFYTAAYYMKIGKTDSTLNMLNRFTYKLVNDSDEYKLQMRCFFLKGNALIRSGHYKESLDHLYTALQMATASHNNFVEVMARNAIGWAYLDMEQNSNAVYWLTQAIAVAKDTMILEKYPYVYSNLASSYNNLSRFDSAGYFIIKAMRGARKYGNLTALANALNIQADVYLNSSRKTEAGKSLEEAIDIRRQVGDTFYLVSDLAQLAVYYANNQQATKGISTATDGIAMATKAGVAAKLLSLYEALALNYKTAGDFKAYSIVMEKIEVLKDSAVKANAADAVTQIKTKRELTNKDRELNEEHFAVNQKKIQLYGSLLILVLAIVIFTLLFRQSRQKEKLKLSQVINTEKRIAEQAVVKAEENQRNRIAADLHDNLGVQANAILYGTELLQQDHEQNAVLVDNLHDTAKDMLVSLRETLWAMKTVDINTTEVWLRIINFSKQMQRYYQATSISTSGAAPADFSINSADALNAILIVQEAVNNAARHSMASVINIRGEETAKGWEIEICDNGKGFDIEEMQNKKDSYGHFNIHQYNMWVFFFGKVFHLL